MGFFLIITHRKNLQRIQQKQENKFSFKKKRDAEEKEAVDEDDGTEYVVEDDNKDGEDR